MLVMILVFLLLTFNILTFNMLPLIKLGTCFIEF